MANFELLLEGETVGRIDIDLALLRKILGGASASPRLANGHPKSAAINAAQASELLGRADKPMRNFLSRLAEEDGALTWGETKVTFDVKSWPEFADGPLKKLEKALHRVTGEKNSVLIWRIESEWIGLEKGEDEPCRLHVDGPALTALKAALATG
jgi:hypothetical protein